MKGAPELLSDAITTVPSPGAIAAAGPREHPAVLAWAALGGERPRPTAVQRLQKKKKAQVYRLVGAGAGGGDVVAKCSSPQRIAAERDVYERVLAGLPVTAARCYGSLEGPERTECWLFTGDAGGEAYSPQRDDHREIAARWLGLLHTRAAGLGVSDLPDRTPGYYRQQLRSAYASLTTHVRNPALGREDARLLRDVARRCGSIDEHWDQVERWCSAVPPTFVHGDFAPKNMRVRSGPPRLVPFDFGSAGWGSVACDLAQAGATRGDDWDYWAHVDLGAYREAVGRYWPRLDSEAVRMLAAAGKIFRCLVCVSLEAPSFAFEWVENAARNLRVYDAALADAMADAGWGERR